MSPPPAPTAPTAIGVDLGGTNFNVGLIALDRAAGPDAVDGGFTLLDRRWGPTPASAGFDAVVDAVGSAVDELRATHPETSLAGLGVAAAGAIDMPRGVILDAPNLGWRDVPLRDRLQARTGLDTVLENDVNGAAWGEFVAMPADERGTDVLAVWVGTGVGGGLVLGGRVHHGVRHTAGELGHVVIRPDAPRGARTVEDLCSRTGLRRRVAAAIAAGTPTALASVDGGAEALQARDFLEAAGRGDALARDLLDDAAHLLGVAIAGSITMLALPRVVVGGGMTEVLGESWLDAIRAGMRDTVFPAALQDVPVDMTRLRDRAGLLGAAALVLEPPAASG